MKTYRLFGIILVTGKKTELDKIAQVEAGTHHVHRNQKGGPRKRKEELTEAQVARIKGRVNLYNSEPLGGSHVSD
jgi:hypothetical protein